MGFFSFDGSTVSRELDVSVNWIYLGAALALAGGIVYAAWWQIVGFALGLLGGAATLLVAGLAIAKFLDKGVDVEHFAEGLWLATAGGALALVLSLVGLIIASAGGIAPSQTGAPVSHAEPPSEPR